MDVRTAVWNLGVEIQNELLEKNEKLLGIADLKKEVQVRLEEDRFEWVRAIAYPSHLRHFSLSDVNTAFNRYLKKISDRPRFKSRELRNKSFVQRNDMKQFADNKVQINKVGKIECDQHQLQRASSICGKIVRPTVSTDGVSFYFSLSVEAPISYYDSRKTEPIGIDLGIRELLKLSTGEAYTINYEPISHLIRRKQLISKRLGNSYNKMTDRNKSKNLIKLEKSLLEVNKKISNYQNTHIYKFVKDIVSRNPEFIALEDLKLSCMVKNGNLSKSLNTAKFRFIRDQFEYQCGIHGIPIKFVPSKFPSTKTCSSCGSWNDPKTSKVYKCSSCGLTIDRDLNASYNIRDYFL